MDHPVYFYCRETDGTERSQVEWEISSWLIKREDKPTISTDGMDA